MSGRFPDWWRQQKRILRLVEENERLKNRNMILWIVWAITLTAWISK